MSIEDTIGSQDNTPACVVCGKNVQGDRGFAKINHGVMVNLCCPPRAPIVFSTILRHPILSFCSKLK